MKNKLILISLNEINFDYSKLYFKKNNLHNLKYISQNSIRTKSEKKYNLLEPWIQWPTIYTGQEARQHKIFRLGDILKYKKKQIFEIVQSMGYSVGAIMPMNAHNNLKNPKYFFSDPWTKTKSSNDFWSKNLSETISKVVNSNTKIKFNYKDFFILFFAFLKFAKIKNYIWYLGFFVKGFFKKYNLALFLDLFLHDVHIYLIKKNKTDFTSIFFNAGAHIQHHYLFNSVANNMVFNNPNLYINQN